MKKLLIYLIIAVLPHTLAHAQQQLPKATPESQGFSTERLTRIDDNVNEWIKNNWVTGAMVLVTRNGKTVYEKGFGLDNAVTQSPMKPGLLFRLASQTKAVTSVGIMMLYEEGKLMFDDTVGKFIPSFSNIKVLDKFNPADTSYTVVNAKRPITIRDLLTHTSGIGYAQIGSKESNAIYAKNNITAGLGLPNGQRIGDVMTRLGRLPLMHQPGERFTYGLNTDVLGYIIEVASGMTLDRFFSTRIFKPLGMNDTYFYVPKEKQSRLTTLTVEDETGIKPMAPSFVFNGVGMNPSYPNTLEGTYFSGGAGLTATINDYAIFLNMLLNNGRFNGKQILAPSTVRLMTTNQIKNLSLGSDKFGLGFSIVTEAGAAEQPTSVGTFGWGGAFGTSYWVDPRENLTIQIYTQIWNRRHSFDDLFVPLVYQALVK